MHCDCANVGASAIVALGDFEGGNLWTHDRGLLRLDGERRGNVALFNGNMPHMTMPFTGERYSLLHFLSPIPICPCRPSSQRASP